MKIVFSATSADATLAELQGLVDTLDLGLLILSEADSSCDGSRSPCSIFTSSRHKPVFERTDLPVTVSESSLSGRGVR